MKLADSRTDRVAAGGVLCGVAGAVALWAWLLVEHAARRQDLWQVFKGPAAPFLHQRVMSAGFDAPAVIVGIACHLAVSVGWGVLFALFAYGLTRPATVAAGIFWGVVVWAGMFYVVLPIAGLGDMARAAPVLGAVLQHVWFGLALAVAFLPFQKRSALPLEFGPREPLTP